MQLAPRAPEESEAPTADAMLGPHLQQLGPAAAEVKAMFFTQQRLLRQAAAERLALAQHTTQLQVNTNHLQAWTQESPLSAADCRL